MSQRRSVASRNRVTVGSKVRVCVDHMQDLLVDMGLTHGDKCLTGVHMFGEVVSRSRNHYSVRLPAAEEEFQFCKEKVFVSSSAPPQRYYVDFGEKTKVVSGLQLPSDNLPKDYYTTQDEATAAVAQRKQQQNSTTNTTVPADVNVENVSATVVTAPNPASIATTTASPAPNTGGRPQTTQESGHLTDASASDAQEESGDEDDEPPALEDVPPDSDFHESDDDDDSMTDGEEEVQSEHEDETYSWQPPKNWANERKKDDFVRECGEAVWTSPANREHCYSTATGLEQDFSFNVVVARKAVDFFFDALPLSMWRKLARTSLAYAHARREAGGEGTRAFHDSWFTASNYMRVFAAIIMRGLVKSKNDPDFFRDVVRGSFVRTGAEAVVGLSVNQYQQLLRYMHFRGTEERPSQESDEYDKCWHIRPLIKLLQQTFARWFTPGKNNAMDEAGIPSRHRWLRCFNPSKPTKYFIEILMACCSVTRFCWAFFISESSKKTVVNRHREGRVRSKYIKVKHYQPEYSSVERNTQDLYGAAAAQMIYFARKLREFTPDNPMTYRLFADSRWDSILGMVKARKLYNVSYTSTIKKLTDRFHIVKHWKKGKNNPTGSIVKSKSRNKRGKYRSAHTVIDGVNLTTCLWNDSALLGAISADLGTERCEVSRRMGYHKKPIACPRIMFVRGQNFRAVDQNDQLRMCKWRMVFTCKRKAWPRAGMGLVELLVVNIYTMKLTVDRSLEQDDYRWELVQGIVARAKSLEVQDAARPAVQTRSDNARAQTDKPEGCYVSREKGAKLHHWDELKEYIFPDELERYQQLRDANPCKRQHKRKPRRRDQNRNDKKVRNPIYTSYGLCVVCKYQHGIRKETLHYCRECNPDDFTNWPKTNRATGFQKLSHPRLCSLECFEYFHTHNIKGLDYAVPRKRKRTSRSERASVHANRLLRNTTPSPSATRISGNIGTPPSHTPNASITAPENPRLDV